MYKIGDFSRVTGASIRTLRYYDEIDLFKPDEIDLFTSYRYYSESQIEDYNLIVKLKDIGFSLEEIKNMWGNFKVEQFENKKEELLETRQGLDRQVKELDRLKTYIRGGKLLKEPKSEKNKIKTLFETVEKEYKIVKSDYDNLIIYNGKSIKGSPLEQAILNENCDYYLVYNNNNIIDDFWVYHEGNNLCLTKMNVWDSDSLLDNTLFMKTLIKTLRDNYFKITIQLIDEPHLEYRHQRALGYGFTYTKSFSHISKDNENVSIKVYEFNFK